MSVHPGLHLTVGVDVGGTFTDLIAFDRRSGALTIGKVPSTPHDQSVGFLDGLSQLAVDIAGIDALVHGTTIATNAVLQRAGAVCGLITTRGFRDSLEMGRRTRPRIYGLEGVFYPIIPRDLRMEVRERLSAEGEVLVPLDEDDVRRAVACLQERGAEAVVIHFIHSYRNPCHEERCHELVRELWPNRFVTVGSRIIREIREFERGSTVAVNGYTQPIMARYLGHLEVGLKERGFSRGLMIMQGNGGVMSAEVACEQSVQTLMSGPAAGCMSGSRLAAATGVERVINCDMGGTSFDVSLVVGGRPEISAEQEIDYAVPIRVPMIAIHTIGAGGGSICRVNAGGLLQVGPRSAGADPGPVCFGRGGTEPTITDAHVVLGRLEIGELTGTTQRVERQRVIEAMRRQIAEPLAIDEVQAATAIIALGNQQMSNAIRLVSVDKGYDPRDFTLMAYGGAGPLHAVELARELGIPQVLVPRHPGLVSALGCVFADIRHDFVQHFDVPLDEMDREVIEDTMRRHVAAGRELVARESSNIEETTVLHELDMRYEGQTHEFRIPLSSPAIDAGRIADDFARHYRERFDIEIQEIRPFLVNLRTTVWGRRPAPDLHGFLSISPAAGAADQVLTREVCFDGRWLTTQVLSRDVLQIGATVAGPAIVTQMDATTVLPPGSRGVVDELGNLKIDVSVPDPALRADAPESARGTAHVH